MDIKKQNVSCCVLLRIEVVPTSIQASTSTSASVPASASGSTSVPAPDNSTKEESEPSIDQTASRIVGISI